MQPLHAIIALLVLLLAAQQEGAASAVRVARSAGLGELAGPRAKRFLYNSGGGCEAFEVQCFNHVDCMAQYRSPSYMCAVGECKSTCVPVPRQ
ncbi:hypothetical protein BOX15_Mlig025436g3 [Macrostomum lignano]|uniref:ShKT domain-containing protein n=1 Tax=Macrostomum lignano TaxID=282301 RepID=A0A267DLA0_9PLAT|nr:hypothetical protein BOX15_Mlig025436g3 [Macrostomum lignano]